MQARDARVAGHAVRRREGEWAVSIAVDFAKLGPGDVLDLAAFIEHEARERYELFADHLEREGEMSAAQFFRHMAELEDAHGEHLARRRERRFAGLPAHLRDAVEWDVEGPPLDRDATRLALARALEIALASERRARDFFAGAMEFLVDEPTRRVLSELRDDEVAHIRMLEEYRDALSASGSVPPEPFPPESQSRRRP
jgi:erythrin-vacuolar iron transport family protein